MSYGVIIETRVIFMVKSFLKIEIFWGHEVLELYFKCLKITFFEILYILSLKKIRDIFLTIKIRVIIVLKKKFGN